MTTMKLLMAAMLLFYSYFQFIAWKRNKASTKNNEKESKDVDPPLGDPNKLTSEISEQATLVN